MEWRGIKFDWNHARAFLVTAEEGSLSAAARVLGMTQPTLGRQVSALEEELSVVLFERHGRGLELTPVGHRLSVHVNAMAKAANQLSLAASGQSESIEGSVCVSTTDSMAAYMLPPVLRELRSLYPGITIELIVTNDVSDLRRREADIALRAFQPTQPDLIAKKLRRFRAYLYATPQYLKSIHAGEHFSDLKNAEFMGFEKNERFLKEFSARGLELSQDNFCLTTENHIVQWELVKAGMGVGIMLDDIGDNEPSVVKACKNFAPYEADLWLVSHRELRYNRRVKAVFDFLSKQLQVLK